MWKYLTIGLLACAAACTGANGGSDKSAAEDADNANGAAASILGQWEIENVVENDSAYVRPAEIESGMTASIDFKEDNTFGVMTNCNHLAGKYAQRGDSISLTDISYTELACDNMELEEMLKKVMPMVSAIDCINDSIVRLNADKAESYIVLKKRKTALK